METFVLILGQDTRSKAVATATSSAILEEYRNLYGGVVPFDADHVPVPGGVCVAVKRSGAPSVLVHTASTPQHACVVFGTLARNVDPAVEIVRAFEDGGAGSAAELDGCFCAVVIERRTETATVFGDGAGQRTARYAHGDGVVLVSPHDLAICATGGVPALPDEDALTSLSAIGWPIGDRPLLAGLRAVRPHQSLRVANSMSELSDLVRAPVPTRLDVATLMVETLSPQIAGGVLTAELSAGLDSRAALAAALAAKAPSDIVAFSDGEPASLDVRVAREVARCAGVRFENAAPATRDMGGLAAEIRALGWAANGIGNAAYLTTNAPVDFARAPSRSLSGEGGEIFSGAYYPWSPVRSFVPERDVDPVATMTAGLRPFGGADATERVRTMLAGALGRMGTGHDALDDFYLYERFGVWNQKQRRVHGSLNRVSPFYGRRAIAAYRSRRAPRAAHATPHADLIRTYLPSCYGLPVNAQHRLPLRHGPAPLRLMQRTLDLQAKVARKVGAGMPVRQGARSLADARSDAFLAVMADGLLPTRLDASDSVAAGLLGEAGVARLIGSADTERLGALSVVDAYFAAARKLRAASRRIDAMPARKAA